MGTIEHNASRMAVPKAPAPDRNAGPFQFTVSSFETMAADEGGLESIEVEGIKMNARHGQLILDVTDEAALPKILAEYNATILAQEELALPPKTTGNKKDGTFKQLPGEGFVKKPCYLVSVPTSDSDDLSDLPAIATNAGVKGKFTFKSKRMASLVRKAFKMNVDHRASLRGVSLNTDTELLASTSEGASVTSGAGITETSPNGGAFWWSAPYTFGAWGGNINNPYGNSVWAYGNGATLNGQTGYVAVIDSGFQGDEPYMPYAVVAGGEWTYNYAVNGSTGQYSIRDFDAETGTVPWHGRQVASLVFAPKGDSAGTHGSAYGANPILIHMNASDGWQRRRSIDLAVLWGAKLINMSFGKTEWAPATYWDPAYNGIQDANSQGVVMVAAAGNTGNQEIYPAAYTEVMSVSSSGKNNGVAQFPYPFAPNTSNVDLYAPGIDVAVAADPGPLYDRYQLAFGTSVSAPIVTGVVAVAMEKGYVWNTASAISHFRNKAYWHYGAAPALSGIGSVSP